MTIPADPPPSSRARLEASANVVRQRLARRLDELHNRKEAILHPLGVVRRHPRGVVALGLAVGLLVGVGVAVAGYRVATRAERLRHARWGAWRRIVMHPEELEPARGGALATMAEKSVTAAVTAGIAVLVKHYAQQALSG